MKQGIFSLSSVVVLALVAAPLVAWADARPDFDDDAKPILRHQPGLVEYVEANFDVKDTGTAKYPGDDDRRPTPPYIFRARPIGSNGPYNLRLLIQPGPAGHILGVVDITKMHLTEPASSAPKTAVASRQAIPQPQQPAPVAKAAPAPASSGPVVTPQPATPQAPEPTSDTPSGPIGGTNSQQAPSTQPSLEPPPDPAPATH